MSSDHDHDQPTDDDVPVRAGHPRLVVASGGSAPVGSPEAAGIQPTFTLDADLVTLGSADTQDIQLAGLAPEHGEIRREADEDEWVYRDVHPSTASRVDGVVTDGIGLHHGDRLDLGPVMLVFQRDEAVDHGRPAGGREGGDFAGGRSGAGGGEATEPG
jgi:hypothetical protein